MSKNKAPNQQKNCEEIEQELQQLKLEQQQLTEQLEKKEEAHRRALADYQNLQRQANLEKQRLIKQAAANLVADLLPTFDNLQRAQQHFADDSLQMIVDDLWSTLQRYGLEQIPIEPGKTKFDHQLMEVVDTQPGENQVVLAQTQSGYTFNGVILRHAQVIVGKEEQPQNKK